VSELVTKAEAHDYADLFRLDLNWSAPDHQPLIYSDDDGEELLATNVASFKGLRVWVCPECPGSSLEAKLEQLIAKTTTDRLIIFHDDEKQIWRWPSRTSKGSGVISRPARHVHHTASTDSKFAEKLEAIRLPVDVTTDVNYLLTRVRAAFDVETKNETKRASKLMARMYAAVEKAYPEGFDPKQRDHEISVSLARILFLLFGDDTEMWATDQFQDFIKFQSARDGSDIASRLNTLFDALDAPPGPGRSKFDEHVAAFPHVNGGIFRENIELPDLNKEFRDAVLDAAAVDWSTISPAIFGSMFQSVRDAQTRRELGEHYTSEENILKTLNPLFLDELRSAFDAALARETTRKKVNALKTLWDRLGAIRYMDPACGCGNFIIVAYRELRELELQVMGALADHEQGEGSQTLGADWTTLLKVTLDHFHGIEIDEWPARIAETAMFLIDRQCDLRLKDRFGEAPQRLPIQREARIVVGNALRIPWEDICPPTDSVVIAGNPPFLGHATRTAAQAQELRDVWGKDDISRLDYVTGWHARALSYFGNRPGLWAFVTTNSITQGDPVPHLFGPIFKAGWRIKFGHRTFPWTSEAAGKAAVHCVIIGFARSGRDPRLFDYAADGSLIKESRAKSINAYLVDGPSVFVTKRTAPLSPGLPTATFGNMPRDDGNLIVLPDELQGILADNTASKFLRPFMGSEDLLHNKERWCLWLTDATPAEINASPVLRSRTEAVRKFRADSTAASTRGMAQTPHLFGQRPALHHAPYVIIPRVCSELRPFFPVRHVDPEVIASDATFTASDPDGYLFAIVSSAMFLAWQKAIGGRLKSDLRFSNTIVWNNLPLPAISISLRTAVIGAGQGVLTARELHPHKSLAQLYTPEEMPSALVAAHGALDEVVDRAFGARTTCATEEERQEVLFQRYVELTGTSTVTVEGLFPGTKDELF
jgi:hypothetical protein